MTPAGPHDRDLVPPVHHTVTFTLDDEALTGRAGVESRFDPVYTRHGNPTLWELQEALAALEGAESAQVFASGMAAISTTLLTLLKAGDRLISTNDIYGGSDGLLRAELPRFGIEVVRVDPTDFNALAAAATPNTRAFCFESVSNPLLKVMDLRRLVALAQSVGAHTILDNTFVTPQHCRPLDLGIDLVVHSLTKYLSGHSDVIAGCVSGRRDLVDRIWLASTHFGGVLDPGAAALVRRGLRTFALRMAQHETNAHAVAALLEQHPSVAQVRYTGLPSHPQHRLAASQFRGYGGMMNFTLRGGADAASAFLRSVAVVRHAVSLGGVQSLACQPWNSTHSAMPEAERRTLGIVPGLIRLSVGCEDTQVLLDDLAAALAAAFATHANGKHAPSPRLEPAR